MLDHTKGGQATPSESRLDELLDSLTDKELTTNELQELRDLLEQSEENRRTYLKAIHSLSSMQKWATSKGDGDLQGLLSLANTPGQDQSESVIDIASKTSKINLSFSLIGSLAAVLVLSFVLRLGGNQERDAIANREPPIVSKPDLASAPSIVPTMFVEDTQQIVARVVSVSKDLRWADGAAPSDFLMRFRPGDLVGIESGRAQIQFTSDAILFLDSKCKLQITSPDSARLIEGMLVGRSNGEASFTIVTPSATVVDIGTEFGVKVGETGTDVSVFDGEVHVHGLHTTEPMNGFVRQLREGMSVRVDREGLHRNVPESAIATLNRGRENLYPSSKTDRPKTLSLLDLIAGKDYRDPVVAGSIDAITGFWGRHQGFNKDKDYWATIAPGDRHFRATEWNPLVEGVFVPGTTGVATQYNSAGASIDLPATSGESWGPIWSRRRLELEPQYGALTKPSEDYWGGGSFERATARLARSNDGLLGIHANVGITFDLQAIRERAGSKTQVMQLIGSIANLDNSQLMVPPRDPSKVDTRFFVDGELRYSRIGFGLDDGEEDFSIKLSGQDRFLTIVATDADNSIHHDHIILIDPRFEPVKSLVH